MTGPGDQHDQHDHADATAWLSTEAPRLLAAFQEWARTTFPAPAGGRAGTDCEWCPLCQFAAVLRGERPELTDRVVEAGATLLAMGRAFLEAATSAAAEAQPARPRPRPRPRPYAEGDE